MKSIVILIASAAIILLVIDLLWLGVIAKNLYQAEIGGLLKKEFNVTAALAFYVLYVMGLTVFVLLPAHESGSVLRALAYGAFFGLVAYGTYDLTNLATLEGFTLRIALIDMGWGAFVSGVTSAGAVAIARHFG
ncbi:MAG: DUF2177 family protein [Beijerinckiaceae bacterium]|nr:DUF2177 family protein [Beijerinckiaceae bacterium]